MDRFLPVFHTGPVYTVCGVSEVNEGISLMMEASMLLRVSFRVNYCCDRLFPPKQTHSQFVCQSEILTLFVSPVMYRICQPITFLIKMNHLENVAQR